MFVYSEDNNNYLYEVIQLIGDVEVRSYLDIRVSYYNNCTIEKYLEEHKYIHKLTLHKLIEFNDRNHYEINKFNNYFIRFLTSLIEEKDNNNGISKQ